MTELGEKAVEAAVKNEMRDTSKDSQTTDAQIEAFVEKLIGISPVYENFNNMSYSV